MLAGGARRYAMVVLTVVFMFNIIDRQILGILLPAISDEFGVGDTVLGLLAGAAFVVFHAALGVPVSRLADRGNRRNLVALLLAAWSGMTALCGLAQTLWQLAAARIGVGVGEGGSSPAIHSMIADYYPPERRSAAMGFYLTGVSVGVTVAYIVGGWVAENLSWRTAFLVVGLPGLLLALLVRFTVAEPLRGASEARVDSERSTTLREVFDFLRARRSALHLGVAAGLSSLVGYSVLTFMPEFFTRSFGGGLANIGFQLGPIFGVASAIGLYGGGLIADRMGRLGQRRAIGLLAIFSLAGAGGYAVTFLAPSRTACLVLFAVPTVISYLYLAPALSQIQGLASLRIRATASAIVLLLINVIGLGAGPFVTGAISDLLAPAAGNESMRYSLLVVCIAVLPWAAWHFRLASRHIEPDLARATEND